MDCEWVWTVGVGLAHFFLLFFLLNYFFFLFLEFFYFFLIFVFFLEKNFFLRDIVIFKFEFI